MKTPKHDPGRTPASEWIFIIAATLAGLAAAWCCLPARGAPAPIPRRPARAAFTPAPRYLLCWGSGGQPQYAITLHPDGTQATLGVSYTDGAATHHGGKPWTGHWRYDRAGHTLTVVESLDGGAKTVTYTVDMATMRGKTKCGSVAVELREVK